MTEKLQQTREIILRNVESGAFPGGEKLPSARVLAKQTGIAFTIVQMAFNTLIADGILARGISRQGTRVRKDWQQRILQENVRVFCPFWEKFLQETMPPVLPELRPTQAFPNGAFEIRFTNDAIQHQQEYQDLSEFVEELYPGGKGLFQARIDEFRDRNGRLFGLPLCFSPWFICCRQETIRANGGQLPDESWEWTDFLNLIRTLRKKLPPEEVFAPFGQLASLLALYFHLGGGSWNQEQIFINTPESLRAIRMLQELAHLSGAPLEKHVKPGGAALTLCTNGDVSSNAIENCRFLPLPRVSQVPQRTLTGGSLLCVRRSVSDFEAVRKMVQFLLSDEIQTKIFLGNGDVPIRRELAMNLLDERKKQDRLVLSELPRIVPTGFSLMPEAARIFTGQLRELLKNQAAPEKDVIQLQSAVEMLLKFSKIC